MHHLQSLDYIVFFIYFIVVSGYGYWVFRRKMYHQKGSGEMDSKDFFLAEGSLTWWAIGASLIASNISAEHFIGMSGSGFALGLAISSYEWMASATLIIIAIFFIPIYLKNKIFTMPQFLSKRYNDTVSTVMAIFWLLVYVFVNLTSIIYLGALAVNSISGISFTWCMIGLGAFSIIVTLGGMKVIGYTDVIQVLVLIMGGLVTCYLALTLVSEHFGFGKDILKGLSIIKDKAPSHFHMIFDKSNPYYKDLPGLSVLIGGMWINNLNYWGCNQYITQRALGASLPTARKGILFAAFLKLLVPVIVVIPGITMFVMYQNGMFHGEMADVSGVIKPDHSYPTLMNLLPNGLKGLAFAALTAAIVASLAGKANSISTIFSLDIYRKFFDKNATEKKLVKTGRITIVVAMVLATLVAPALKNLDQAYQFIQEYVGFISPGVLSIFLLGFFWKRATSAAALASAILTIPLSTLLKFLPGWTNGAFPDIPFMNRMGLVFIILMVLMVVMSLADRRSKNNPRVIEIDTAMFRCSPAFIIGSTVVVGILVALYTIFY
ncbi:MAG: sodium/sugar symporter [Ginsengibacter sp.]